MTPKYRPLPMDMTDLLLKKYEAKQNPWPSVAGAAHGLLRTAAIKLSVYQPDIYEEFLKDVEAVLERPVS